MGVFSKQMTREQGRDTGMAMVLLLLILYLFQRREGFIYAAMTVHVLNMTAPGIFRPAAVVWLGLSHLLGTVVSKIVLSLVFFAVVTPVGVLRRLAGKDSLKLRAFKASGDSVMLERNHKFAPCDMERPY